MLAVVTPEEMRAIDAAAPEPVETLIERAGGAVAREAMAMLGGCYGRTVNVLAGKGNNGADGRAAARRLEHRGAQTHIIDAATRPPILARSDLVIDAAYGTGFRGEWTAPDVGDAAVLAVDIPSGVDATTGDAGIGVLPADRTVTFQALKPGLLFGPGSRLAGEIVIADIGLDVTSASQFVVEAADAGSWWPHRSPEAHKWDAAVQVVAGSASMPGAAQLCTGAALRSGAGLVSLATPGVDIDVRAEIVRHPIPAADFSTDALRDIARYGALVIGPGLGRSDDVLTAARRTIAEAPVPVVVDGDGLFACSWSADGAGPLLRSRELPTIVTPHDREFAYLTGRQPGSDRVAAARAAAADLGCIVLLKGPTTIIAAPPSDTEPWPDTHLVDHGDHRLATAGSGDVLAGMIGAALAAGAEPARAAAAAAWIHGEAGRSGPDEGGVAGDLVDRLPEAIAVARRGAIG